MSKKDYMWCKISTAQESDHIPIDIHYNQTVPDSPQIDVTIGQLSFSLPFYLAEQLCNGITFALTDYELDHEADA